MARQLGGAGTWQSLREPPGLSEPWSMEGERCVHREVRVAVGKPWAAGNRAEAWLASLGKKRPQPGRG